jgi:hypothetical protein
MPGRNHDKRDGVNPVVTGEELGTDAMSHLLKGSWVASQDLYVEPLKVPIEHCAIRQAKRL